MNRVAVVAGMRTPFVKSGKAFKDLGPLRLARESVRGLLKKQGLDAEAVESLAFGVVVPERGKPNLAREIVFEEELPSHIEAQTVSSYCITGLRTIASVADAIATGRIACGIAGGVDSLSHSDPSTFQEPSTGLSMGEHTELTRKAWDISRGRQDEIALASHRHAVAARDKLAAEILPVLGIDADSGPRADTSIEALGALRPVFDPEGMLTAGNSSPVTDGASAVLLMSEERARSDNLEPLAFIRTMAFAALDPSEGLLMAPAIAVPHALSQSGLKLSEIDLIEMHEAFGAQVLANAAAWEKGWKGESTGHLHLIRRHILPQAYSAIAIQATLLVPAYMLAEVTLSYVGLGVGEPLPSWGNMLADLPRGSLLAAEPWTFAPAFLLVAVTWLYHSVLSSLGGHHSPGNRGRDVRLARAG